MSTALIAFLAACGFIILLIGIFIGMGMAFAYLDEKQTDEYLKSDFDPDYEMINRKVP